MGYNHVTPEDIFRNEEVRCYIQRGNDCLGAIGYTEHGFAHAKKSSDTAREILAALGYPQRDCELAAIAGYMHDIGNTVNPVSYTHLDVYKRQAVKELYLHVALGQVHHPEEAVQHRRLGCAHPDVHPLPIHGGGVFQIAVVQGVDHLREAWVGRALGAVDDQRRAGQKLVQCLPELWVVFHGEASFLGPVYHLSLIHI